MVAVSRELLEHAAKAIGDHDVCKFMKIFSEKIYPAFMTGYQQHMEPKGIYPKVSKEKLTLVLVLLQFLFVYEPLLRVTHNMNYAELLNAAQLRIDNRIRKLVGVVGKVTKVSGIVTLGISDRVILGVIKHFIKKLLGRHVAEHLDIDMLTYMISNVEKIVHTYSNVLFKNRITARDVTRLNPPILVVIGISLLAVDESHIHRIIHQLKSLIDKHVLGKDNNNNKNLVSEKSNHKPNDIHVATNRKTRAHIAPDVKETVVINTRRRTASSPIPKSNKHKSRKHHTEIKIGEQKEEEFHSILSSPKAYPLSDAFASTSATSIARK